MGGSIYALVPLFVAICGAIHHLTAVKVTDPYIDEIFHLRQCQTYCEYRFDEWDDKITTPPGLYLLGVAYAQTVRLVASPWLADSAHLADVCRNKDVLRSLNLLGGIVVFPLVLSLLKKNFRNCQFWSLNVIAIPLIFPYYFLFYTDAWASILILASLALGVRSSSAFSVVSSGVVAFISLWFRQTNIVWIAFILSVVIEKKRSAAKDESFVAAVFGFIQQLIKSWALAIPYVVNIGLFALFIKINGGITFGDKENHELNLHLVQVFYCFTFITALTWPIWLSVKHIKRYLSFAFYGNYGLNFISSVLSGLAIKYVIDNFTVVHPFLLADNRHYTFYIYRKILSKPHSYLLTVPIYHFATWTVVKCLFDNQALSPITILTFLGGTVITIIPSPLFEPRYYIVPFLLFRVFTQPPKPSRQARQFVEFAWYMGINSLLFYVFFHYEFKWQSEGDIIQRIIW